MVSAPCGSACSRRYGVAATKPQRRAHRRDAVWRRCRCGHTAAIGRRSSGLVRAFGLPLGALPAGTVDRRPEDFAEACARIRRAKLGHRALFFVDFLGLDRQRDLAGGAIDRGDLGVDLLADRKPVRALLAAVARQLGFADKAQHSVADRDLDAALGDAGNRAGYHLASAQFGKARLERVGFELFDAEADALLFDIDVKHLGAHHLALVIGVEGVLAGPVPVDVGQMHHAVDIARKADEQPKFGNVADLALDHAAHRMLFGKGLPRVGERLFEPETDAPLLRVDIEHHDLDLLAGRDNLARMHILLGPAHLRNMDQPLDPRFEFDKGAVIGDVGYAAAEFGAGRIFELDPFPRIGLELLHAEADALRLGVEADHLDLDILPDGQGFGGVVDPPPGDVGHMQQPIDPAEIDKSPVIGDVFDHTVEDLALLEAGDQFRALFGAAFLEHRPARDNDVAARAVHLEDLERLRRAQ